MTKPAVCMWPRVVGGHVKQAAGRGVETAPYQWGNEERISRNNDSCRGRRTFLPIGEERRQQVLHTWWDGGQTTNASYASQHTVTHCANDHLDCHPASDPHTVRIQSSHTSHTAEWEDFVEAALSVPDSAPGVSVLVPKNCAFCFQT